MLSEAIVRPERNSWWNFTWRHPYQAIINQQHSFFWNCGWTHHKYIMFHHYKNASIPHLWYHPEELSPVPPGLLLPWLHWPQHLSQNKCLKITKKKLSPWLWSQSWCCQFPLWCPCCIEGDRNNLLSHELSCCLGDYVGTLTLSLPKRSQQNCDIINIYQSVWWHFSYHHRNPTEYVADASPTFQSSPHWKEPINTVTMLSRKLEGAAPGETGIISNPTESVVLAAKHDVGAAPAIATVVASAVDAPSQIYIHFWCWQVPCLGWFVHLTLHIDHPNPFISDAPLQLELKSNGPQRINFKSQCLKAHKFCCLYTKY